MLFVLYVVKETSSFIFASLKNYELTSEIRFKKLRGMSNSVVSTCGEELSGLCELCIKEAAEIECASCGPVRVNSTGALIYAIETLL